MRWGTWKNYNKCMKTKEYFIGIRKNYIYFNISYELVFKKYKSTMKLKKIFNKNK